MQRMHHKHFIYFKILHYLSQFQHIKCSISTDFYFVRMYQLRKAATEKKGQNEQCCYSLAVISWVYNICMRYPVKMSWFTRSLSMHESPSNRVYYAICIFVCRLNQSKLIVRLQMIWFGYLMKQSINWRYPHTHTQRWWYKVSPIEFVVYKNAIHHSSSLIISCWLCDYTILV